MRLNLPNRISLLRIILIPFLIFFMVPFRGSIFDQPAHFQAGVVANIFALLIFIAAVASDYFDGLLARQRKEITTLGKFLDTVADKLLIITVFSCFALRARMHFFFVFIILLRELSVTGLRTVAAAQGKVIAAGLFGKIKASLQMWTCTWLYIEVIAIGGVKANADIPTGFLVIGNIFIALTIIVTVLSGLDYLIKNRKFISA